MRRYFMRHANMRDGRKILRLCFQRDMVCDKLAQIQLAAGMVDVDPDQVTLAVIVQNDTFRDFLAFNARLVRKIDIQRIGIWKIVQFHGRNLRSTNALCMVSLSESVTTRKKRPCNSSTLAQ